MIAVVGILMIIYVLVGGMKGTTWVQIIKAVLLISGAALMTLIVLFKFGFNFSEILGEAQKAISGSTTEAVASRDVLAPGATSTAARRRRRSTSCPSGWPWCWAPPHSPMP